MKTTFYKFFKFGLVGVSGTAVDFGVTSILKELLGVNKFLANSIGFLVAATTNFFLNRRWTFKSTEAEVWQQYIKFLSVSLVGMLISNAIIYLCESCWGINFYVSKVIATLVVLFWNFVGNLFFTFK